MARKNAKNNKISKAKKKKKNAEANKLLPEFRKIDGTPDNVELVCTKTDVTKYDFNHFSLPNLLKRFISMKLL